MPVFEHLPCCDKGPKYHSKYCELNWSRECLPGKIRNNNDYYTIYYLGVRHLEQHHGNNLGNFTYFNKNPSASIVNKIENLLNTVNIGRLMEEKNKLLEINEQH